MKPASTSFIHLSRNSAFLDQWFWNLSMHQNHLGQGGGGGACSNTDCWAPPPEFLIQWIWGEMWEFSFLTLLQLMLMLLSPGDVSLATPEHKCSHLEMGNLVLLPWKCFHDKEIILFFSVKSGYLFSPPCALLQFRQLKECKNFDSVVTFKSGLCNAIWIIYLLNI